jgi:hypothetical protein
MIKGKFWSAGGKKDDFVEQEAQLNGKKAYRFAIALRLDLNRLSQFVAGRADPSIL